MPKPREIKKRIDSIDSTRQITRAMKMVAAARLRRAQEQLFSTRPYSSLLSGLLGSVAMRATTSRHHLLRKPESVDKAVLIVVSAERGLCGAFNSNIVRRAFAYMREHEGVELMVIPVGSKGAKAIKRQGVETEASFVDVFKDLKYESAREIAMMGIDLFSSNQADRVDVLYNEFKSPVEQRIVVQKLLPIEREDLPSRASGESRAIVDYVYEPGQEDVLDALLPMHVIFQMWHMLLESQAAEHGARMTAMEAATDSATDMIDELTLTYQRERQTAITKEIADIVGGAEALR
jgi:F-type H+-transporting ATPase subunit gamma